MTTASIPLSIYQLRIVLRGISPLIWRRVLLYSHTTLAHLHTILQILFAWSDEHLHSWRAWRTWGLCRVGPLLARHAEEPRHGGAPPGLSGGGMVPARRGKFADSPETLRALPYIP